MNKRTVLSICLVAVVALWTTTGSASATFISSDEGETPSITAESTNSKLDGSFVTVECSKSEVKGKVEQHGTGVTVKGNVSALTFSSCNYSVTVNKAGSLEVHETTGGNGTVTSSGAEISIHTSVGTCVFTTTSTDIGSLTGGAPAKLDIESAKIPRTGGNFLCGSSGTWTGNYTVTSPSDLYVGEGGESHPIRTTPGSLLFPTGVQESRTLIIETKGPTVETNGTATFVRDMMGTSFPNMDYTIGSLVCWNRHYGSSCTATITSTASATGNGWLKIPTTAGDKYVRIYH